MVQFNKDLLSFPIVVSPGVKYKDTIVIQLEDIYIPPAVDNPVRKKGKNAYHVQKLVTQLRNGIDYTKMPPVVCKNPRIIDGKQYKYELICGNHRLEAMSILGIKEWIFWLYDVAIDGYSYEDSVRTLQLEENNHATGLESSDHDVSNIIKRLIKKGSRLVTNDIDSIRNYVDAHCSNMHYNTRAKVVRQVVRDLGTYQDVVTYTANDAFKWIAQETDYSVAGKIDPKRKKYGWTVLEGYEYEYLFNSMKKFSETDKESYFLCHTRGPTDKQDLEGKRLAMKNAFESLEESLLDVFEFYKENGRFPWKIEGFLPQDQLKNEKKLVIV
jgi:hypothetical protein